MKYHVKRPPRQFMIAVCWVKTAIVFVAIWLFALIWTTISLDNIMIASSTSTKRRYSAQQNAQPNIQTKKENNKDIAIEIPGIELQIPYPTDSNEDPIQIVYTDYTTITNTTPPPRGIVLLLHACSHSAFKFFSPSQTCINCVGLSEELRIVRLVIEEGYTPIAISSINRVRGCWSMKQDMPRIESVLKYWREEEIQQYDHVVNNNNIFAIGASSGGAFAAELLTRDVVQGALVMVMSLSNNVMQKMKQKQTRKPIYLAPMPRDANTMQHVIQNYKECDSIMKEYIVLDKSSCASLPVTIEYLIQRVPGMTVEMGNELIQQLKQAKHIDTISNMLVVDPTKSKWRDIITSTTKNKTHWMDIFDLTPGYSPLAKALHRAWAFHEYCSEVVVPALRFFESHKTRSVHIENDGG